MTFEQFIDEAIRKAEAANYKPTQLKRLWAEQRTAATIEKLVTTPDMKSGFKRMAQEGLKDWTLEAAVMKYPERFSEKAQTYAQFKLNSPID